MASKNKNKPVTDILSKASKALAKSRQLRDPGKTLINSNSKNVPVSKKASLLLSRKPSATVKLAEKANNNNIDVPSSDDDDVDIDLLDEKSPSTFLEAMDNLYNSTVVSTRKTNKMNISANVNIRSNEISDFSAKSDISSGTPSISITASEKGDNSKSINENHRISSLRMTRAQMTMQSSPAEVGSKEVIDENVEDVPIGKTHNSLMSINIPESISPIPRFTAGSGHPHETVAALMKRGDRVSEETYRVLQMMVIGSDVVNEDLEYKRKFTDREVITDSVEDDALKTDASISMALEEEEGEGEFEAPVSFVSENVTYVGGTMKDIVENLMSLDLEEEEETLTPRNELEADVFEFKAENTQEASYTYPEEDEEEYEYINEEEPMTLKEFIYESDFEQESSKKFSVSSSRNTKSEISRTNNTQQSLQYSKSPMKSNERSVSFSKSANKAAKSSNKFTNNLSASGSEKTPIPSARLASSVSSSIKKVVYPKPLPLSVPATSSTPQPKITPKEITSPSKYRAKIFETKSSRSEYPREKRSVSRKKINDDKPLVVPVPQLDDEQQNGITIPSTSRVNMEKMKNTSPRLKQQSSSKCRVNVIPSKSRIWKNNPNPIDDLMNIDGEKSSRQRQKILSILRKELYEKELKRLNREQLRAERIQKKREKEQEDDYRMLMNFRMTDRQHSLPETVESWDTRSSYVNAAGNSTEPPPPRPHLSQMITLMNKYNFAAAGLQNNIPSQPAGNTNFGAPYFTRSGAMTEGNFRAPEHMEIPELVQEVLDSHHRMYAMTIQSAKQMGKKYKEFLKVQNKRQENKSAPGTKAKTSKVNLAR